MAFDLDWNDTSEVFHLKVPTGFRKAVELAAENEARQSLKQCSAANFVRMAVGHQLKMVEPDVIAMEAEKASQA